MPDPSTTTLVLLALAGLAAGFVDAVVGGSGLIQLPALVIGLPAAAPVNVLATNKLSSICGTSVSSAMSSSERASQPIVSMLSAAGQTPALLKVL